MEEQEIEEWQELERELQEANRQNRKLYNAQMSMFGQQQDENLIKWQLDLREELDRIYHLLRGHQIKEDEKGNIVYVEPEDESLRPFNEYGVQLIMNIMSFYLNRNTILSNYDEETINHKIFDIGQELVDLIFNKYEEVGMDTQEKMKLYPMIIRELVDSVHSAYLRALHGGERNSLRTARTVTQNESPMRMPNYPVVNQPKKSLLNPFSWFRS